jgi:hypothetical protein
MAGSQLETDDLFQWAVLWPALPLAATDGQGQQRIGPAVDIPARWSKGSRLNQAALEQNKTATAEVVVDREIPVGSILWQGQIADLPSPLRNLYQVLENKERWDVKGRNVRRSVVVTSFNETLPESV